MTLSIFVPRLFKSLALAALLGASALPAAAQNLFAPVARINDTVVTEFEVQQRLRFLQLLSAPDATRDAVIDALIDDRLRAKASADVGIEVTPEGMREGMSNFASRANLSTEEFNRLLSIASIENQSLD